MVKNKKRKKSNFSIPFKFAFLILLLFPNTKINKLFSYEIPELNIYNNQQLKLLIPSKKCKPLSPRTLYFESSFRRKNIIRENEINYIALNETNKKFFITYYMNNTNDYSNYDNILKINGLIKSNYLFHSHNIFLNGLNESAYKNMRRNDKLNKYQRIYSYIKSNSFHNKAKLYKEYNFMKKKFNDDYNFMVDTFVYPDNENLINRKFNDYTFDLNDLWLVKPSKKSRGSGIFFLKSLKEILYDEFIIVKYIQYPDLINNKKYDLRLYVLLSGIKPLRIYLNKEGIVRISSEKYNLTEGSTENKNIFLTNTAINKGHKDYIFPKNDSDNEANIWNLKTYEKYLIQKNIDYNVIHKKIKDIIIKTIVSFQNNLIHSNDYFNVNDRTIFSVLGFDILINNAYEPILLEVNNKPDLAMYNKVDEKIKTNLFIDTLNIIGIQPFSHKGRYRPFDKEFRYLNNSEELVDNAFCELTRGRGDYELIFPLKENIDYYKKFFIKNNQENLKFWEKILFE